MMPVVVSRDEIRRTGEVGGRKLLMPMHHDVRAKDVDLKRLGAVVAFAHEQDLRDFASLLLVEGLGQRTLQSLARFIDPSTGCAFP